MVDFTRGSTGSSLDQAGSLNQDWLGFYPRNSTNTPFTQFAIQNGPSEMRLIILVGGLDHDFYDFPFSWECHHPSWRTPSFFRGVGIPPTSNPWNNSKYLDVEIRPETLDQFLGNLHPNTLKTNTEPENFHLQLGKNFLVGSQNKLRRRWG